MKYRITQRTAVGGDSYYVIQGLTGIFSKRWEDLTFLGKPTAGSGLESRYQTHWSASDAVAHFTRQSDKRDKAHSLETALIISAGVIIAFIAFNSNWHFNSSRLTNSQPSSVYDDGGNSEDTTFLPPVVTSLTGSEDSQTSVSIADVETGPAPQQPAVTANPDAIETATVNPQLLSQTPFPAPASTQPSVSTASTSHSPTK
ncbi:hypothetical protein TUM12370_19560 [Salmonella enterica subsp. enterica serovar Choleraesuis]|nr:hypothetical protein TUM12370_19560 [Salmonella enterica subsp. enterica serovar Choleraesuis]